MQQITLKQVEDCNCRWFAKGNKQFFGDRSYSVRMSKNGKPYLIRSTYAWTDMFGGVKKLHYRINFIGANLKIGSLVDEIFDTRSEVNTWLTNN